MTRRCYVVTRCGCRSFTFLVDYHLPAISLTVTIYGLPHPAYPHTTRYTAHHLTRLQFTARLPVFVTPLPGLYAPPLPFYPVLRSGYRLLFISRYVAVVVTFTPAHRVYSHVTATTFGYVVRLVVLIPVLRYGFSRRLPDLTVTFFYYDVPVTGYRFSVSHYTFLPRCTTPYLCHLRFTTASRLRSRYALLEEWKLR